MELCQGIRENISTHALTEGDSWPKCTTTISGLFQLTPSRRATVEEAMPVIAWKHISTHALTEGDVPTGKSTGRNGPFQLTPSRRATLPGIHRNLSRGFQLTPSRRATSLQLESSALPEYFNSRPHGGRRKLFQMRFLARLFQLTPSRRATRCFSSFQHFSSISAHALTEGDNPRASCSATASSISTHPLTEGDRARPALQRLLQISTHALTEGDPNTAVPPLIQSISTHALTEGDSTELISSRYSYSFQLTPSRRATSVSGSLIRSSSYFNSRPHGGRPSSLSSGNSGIYFNSRPHGGRPP